MKEKLKILHLSAARNWGGGENHIENLCREFNGVDASTLNLILCVKNASFHKRLEISDLNFSTAPMLIKFDLRYVYKILKLVRKYHINLIHIHDSTALTLAVMATKLGKLPPFILSKKTSFPIKQRPRTLYKYNHPQIQKILCVSEKTKEVTSNSVKDTSKFTTIYHGTSMNKSSKPPFDLKNRFDIPNNKIVVGMIANHIRAKNLETWVRTINHIINVKNNKDFHFVQIGSFSDRSQKYLDLIKELKLDKHISLLGFIPNASALISQFDISLLTSQSEGIPQFIYESFYYKVPVVSTNVGGIPEIIEDGVNGMLSNPYEAQSLADKLIALSNDNKMMEKFAELSHQKLIENYTTRKMAEQTLAEYKKVLYGKN
ncbi:glycosyltransferase family 4 protein [Christiangramia forsetii]|uniref:Glycosyl transferase, group 1 n=2 Tax=Christiangramia forsetii TaxID=411153 RepID=A0M3Q1_CHRFK|nr:glycosyltransferase family 4 protein [Christiangramia forsetii]GGG25265.1 glycosyl transferase group 1 [Christiangramia forsetii]CAL67246.1 glycosyl transferase, group 1 [Christiangramia forsetii KT0803]